MPTIDASVAESVAAAQEDEFPVKNPISAKGNPDGRMFQQKYDLKVSSIHIDFFFFRTYFGRATPEPFIVFIFLLVVIFWRRDHLTRQFGCGT